MAEQIELLPKSRVLVDPTFNARRTYRDIDKLAASIREVGLLQPVVVRAASVDGEYLVVIGHRRRKAYDEPFMAEEIPCVVKHFSSRDDAMLASLASDPSQDPIRNYDLAERLAYFKKEHGMTVLQLADVAGRDRWDVGQLVRCWEELCPEVKDAWGKAPSPEMEIPLAILNRWVKEPGSVQRLLLKNYQTSGNKPILDADGKPLLNTKGKRLDGKSVTQKMMRAKLGELRARGFQIEGSWTQGAIAALRWVLGEVHEL